MTKNIDVVSLEVARKLQAAGYGKEPINLVKGKFDFYYNFNGQLTDRSYGSTIDGGENGLSTSDIRQYIPAPTASRLADELPFFIEVDGKICNLRIEKTGKDFYVRYIYEDAHTVKALLDVHGKPLPDALALMMVYLLENGLITP